MKKKLMRRFCILGVYCLCVLLMLIVSGVGGKAEQTAAISANDCYENRIAITFDDGPGKGTTEKLLDGLKERGVKATFFLVGEKIEDNRELVARMYAEGHLIGNHTYSHIQLTSRNREAFREELVRTNAVLEEITGEKTSFVRPPYGSWEKSFEKELNMFPVLWNIDPLDWCSHNAECIAARVVEKAGDGDIILMHDLYEQSVIAAETLIPELTRRGYQLVTVSEMAELRGGMAAGQSYGHFR